MLVAVQKSSAPTPPTDAAPATCRVTRRMRKMVKNSTTACITSRKNSRARLHSCWKVLTPSLENRANGLDAVHGQCFPAFSRRVEARSPVPPAGLLLHWRARRSRYAGEAPRLAFIPLGRIRDSRIPTLSRAVFNDRQVVAWQDRRDHEGQVAVPNVYRSGHAQR